MIEVFKTNIRNANDAKFLVAEIKKLDHTYIANFDLHDPEKILRVVCELGVIQAHSIIELLKGFGFSAELLEDEKPNQPQVTIDLNLN
jgi:hypothetical protein